MKLNGTHSFEIEIGVSGTLNPAEPQTWEHPGCDASMEDVDIGDIGILRRNPSSKTGWTTTSILDGVDKNSAAYRQIVINILDLMSPEIQESLLSEAE